MRSSCKDDGHVSVQLNITQARVTGVQAWTEESDPEVVTVTCRWVTGVRREVAKVGVVTLISLHWPIVKNSL